MVRGAGVDDDGFRANLRKVLRNSWVELPLWRNPAPWVRPVIFTSIVTMAAIGSGYVTGFAAPSGEEIKKEFNMSLWAFSLFAGVATIGGLLGGPIGVWLTHAIGRKLTISLGSVSSFAGWVCLGLSQTSSMIQCARFVTGFGMGLVTYAAPAYILDISHTPQGTLQCVLMAIYQVGLALGMMLVCTIGACVKWRTLAFIGLAPSLVLLIGINFIPESPIWLSKKNSDDTKGKKSIWKIREIWRELWVGVGILTLQQFSGINAVLLYSNTIFENLGFQWKNIPAIVLGVIQVVFTIVGAWASAKKWTGRQILAISTGSMTVSLLVVALALVRQGDSGVRWFCFLGLVGFVGSYSAGMSILPWIVALRTLPRGWETIGGVIAMIVRSLSALLITIFAPEFLQKSIGGFFGVFATVCLLALFFVTFVPLPVD